MKVTIEYSTNSNAERDRIAMVLKSNLCGRQAYRDGLIIIDSHSDTSIRIWVDHLPELVTAHYVGIICDLISRTRCLFKEGGNEEDTSLS